MDNTSEDLSQLIESSVKSTLEEFSKAKPKFPDMDPALAWQMGYQMAKAQEMAPKKSEKRYSIKEKPSKVQIKYHRDKEVIEKVKEIKDKFENKK